MITVILYVKLNSLTALQLEEKLLSEQTHTRTHQTTHMWCYMYMPKLIPTRQQLS